MTATALPTIRITENERRALRKAIKLNGAALVRRLEYVLYEVPSATREGRSYYVAGTKMDASDHTCTCEAAQRGLKCWHVEAVRLARVQHEAKRQARRLTQAPAAGAAPVATLPASKSQPLKRVALV